MAKEPNFALYSITRHRGNNHTWCIAKTAKIASTAPAAPRR